MTSDSKKLPPEIAEKVFACLEEVEGEYEVRDKRALIGLIVEHGADYPALLDLVKVNEDALVRHYEATGEVPPGVRLVKTTTQEDSNVVGLEVLHGPKSKK